MGLGISIKEDEKAEKDKLRDITLWPREVLEARYKKKQKLFKYFSIMLIVFTVLCLWVMYQYWGTLGELDSATNALGTCVSDTLKQCPDVNGSINSQNQLTKPVIDFFTWIVNLNQPYFFKIMILLGILYLVQIVFSVAMDFIEVILLIFVLIKRSIMGIIKLFRGKQK